MPETVIVTVRWNGQEADFELPSGLPVQAWQEAFCAGARMVFPGFFLEPGNVHFFYNQVPLEPGYTLAECGIYDGSILELG